MIELSRNEKLLLFQNVTIGPLFGICHPQTISLGLQPNSFPSFRRKVHGRFQIPNSKSFTLPILIPLYPPEEHFARYKDIDPSEGFGKDGKPFPWLEENKTSS
ncbi:MAG: hypothetical protein PSV36_05555 [Algoriphagus sp.]|nr:hypothetical protein [Algoriphagus sp.]